MNNSYIYRLSPNTLRLLCLFSGISVLLALSACDGNKYPPDVKMVVKAVQENNPKDFAAVCSYPVERPYPLRDVKDQTEMSNYYDVLMDDSLRKVITKSKPEEWEDLGWRGKTVRDGSYVWVDDNKVYSIPYISKAEKELIGTLSEEEMKSLPQEMRAGWHPAGCLVSLDDGSVFRIDANDRADAPTDSLLRMSIYNIATELTGLPDMQLTGFMKTEGSAGIRTYYFRDTNGDSLEYSPDDSGDNEENLVIWKPVNGNARSLKVAKAYWRDVLKQRPDSTSGSGMQSATPAAAASQNKTAGQSKATPAPTVQKANAIISASPASGKPDSGKVK